ncbi:LOW QUALITY PROTEIN: hypothetical protein NC653_013942 [Populus alba x Populus x berolinensis]|uniref:Uncharacterized protein n=1 Tax=Populus alba x Populus x berolinensis TaxID=444605 RepID=A0AAD6QVN1_9ROSI|nr:LOW QUALITY PROTEIN: hypothetical protein NC653_013942 [Populus alba x Populus x berolinensis]
MCLLGLAELHCSAMAAFLCGDQAALGHHGVPSSFAFVNQGRGGGEKEEAYDSSSMMDLLFRSYIELPAMTIYFKQTGHGFSFFVALYTINLLFLTQDITLSGYFFLDAHGWVTMSCALPAGRQKFKTRCVLLGQRDLPLAVSLGKS